MGMTYDSVLAIYRQLLAARTDGAALVVGQKTCAVWDGHTVFGMHLRDGVLLEGTVFDFASSAWDNEKGCWLDQTPTETLRHIENPVFVPRKLSFEQCLAAYRAHLEAMPANTGLTLGRGCCAVLIQGRLVGTHEGESSLLFDFVSEDWDHEGGHWVHETLENTLSYLRKPMFVPVVLEADLLTGNAKAHSLTWAERRYDDILKQARERYGKGWDHMSEDQRENFIAARVLYLLLGQADEKYEPAQARAQSVLRIHSDRKDSQQ